MTIDLVDVRNLTKRFDDVIAVKDVSFRIKSGELVGLIGPNGAGKSTTMRLLAGFLQPTKGKVNIAGIDMMNYPQKGQLKLGYLPEQGGIYGDLTVEEYLTFLARAYQVKDLQKSVDVASRLTRCDRYMFKTMHSLSKGMRQRVFFAGAIVHDPDVLILDEPTDGLDPNQKHEVRLALKELAKTKAVIVSTHILEEAEAICDRVLIMANGKIMMDTTPKDLAKQGKGNIQIAFRVLTTNKGKK